jgi:hypothetical protein
MADQVSDIGTFSLQAAKAFSEKYQNTTNEKQYSQSFWTDLFTKVIGVPDLLAAGIEFEYPVISSEGKTNWIDVFWSGVLLIEQKSTGKNLDLAEAQARGYLVGLPPEHRPPAIILSDFSKFRIIDVLMNEQIEFPLSELSENLHRLELILGKQIASATRQEVSADIHAVELMGNLFNAFDKAGYEGHALSVFLVRVLFLNFGDDTRMWKRVGNGLFADYISSSAPDGSGLGAQIQELFQALNTPNEKRPTTIGVNVANFPYINGGVFEETLPIFSFNSEMRKALIETTQYDWSKISPAIFGAMFQTVKSKEDRRSLGEHYTSEANILKVIRPLFLDDYLEKLTKSWDSPQALKKLRKELAENNYLDPACGSGNFLVVAYKRLRDLELKIVARLNELEGKEGQNLLEGTWGLSVHLNQFFGIEINEWSSQIATIAMFIADHQANISMEEITGFAPERFPLTESAKIFHDNALQVDWAKICPMNSSTFIMGNPPFLGSLLMSDEQKTDTKLIWENHKKTGLVDFVTNWFLKASHYIDENDCVAGFVSTNSIIQGEQPSLLWSKLNALGISIDFAHRPFTWSNEAKGKAAVHVVIVGISKRNLKEKKLWTYEDTNLEPSMRLVGRINGYLIDAENTIVETRMKPLSSEMPSMYFGSMPRDNGHLSKISADEADEIKRVDPIASRYLRKLIGAEELINGGIRYCLWLENATPQDLNSSSVIKSRVRAVQEMRSTSKAKSTRDAAKYSHLFVQRAQPKKDYIAIPLHSSEGRKYIPFAWISKDVIATNALGTIPEATLSLFAILNSAIFNLWAATISGRLESRIRISAEITYNNFPIRDLTGEEKVELEKSANGIINARNNHLESTLGDLYGQTSMPLDLTKAHEQNDKVVLKVFGLKSNSSTDEMLERLFGLYKELSSNNAKLEF